MQGTLTADQLGSHLPLKWAAPGIRLCLTNLKAGTSATESGIVLFCFFFKRGCEEEAQPVSAGPENKNSHVHVLTYARSTPQQSG